MHQEVQNIYSQDFAHLVSRQYKELCFGDHRLAEMMLPDLHCVSFQTLSELQGKQLQFPLPVTERLSVRENEEWLLRVRTVFMRTTLL